MRYRLILLLYFLIASHALIGQRQTFNITGQIQDITTKEYIPLCNIYLSGSTIGTTSDSEGVFALTNIAPGTYDLIISHVNYTFQYKSIEVTNTDVNLGNIFLEEDITDVDAVEVNGRTDRKWKRQFKQFEKFVLGDHFSNREVEIINPYVAEFVEDKSNLKPESPFTLEITNLHTGYQVHFAVEQFEIGNQGQEFIVGYPRFTEMKPGNEEEATKWKDNRQQAHNGSINHFFYALINEQLYENGFESSITNSAPNSNAALSGETLRYNEKVTGKNISDIFRIEKTPNPDIYRIYFSGFLKLKYLKEYGANQLGQTSHIELLNQYIEVNKNGIPLNPLSFKVHGYLATEGLYEMLPSDLEFNTLDMLPNALDAGTIIADNLLEYTTSYAQEKVYLHLAKPYYSLGETLWYKAYVMAGPTHLPTPISQNLKVELLNPENELIYDQTLFIDEGTSNGDIILADTLPPGEYTIRAYTPWMLNFSSGYAFHKKVAVFGTENSSKPNEIKPVNIQFFPEGGDLLLETESIIAFETTPTQNPIEGTVWNSEGEAITTFKTSHDNLGSFSFTPKKGEKYYATIADSDKQFDLPQPKDRGYTLSLTETPLSDSLIVTIKSTGDEKQTHNAQLLIHTRGITHYNKPILWQGNTASLTINKSAFPSGIAHLTLFNKNWLPEAERLTFHSNKEELLKTELNTDKPNYTFRDSTEVTLRVTDKNGNPVIGKFSATVFDSEQIQPSAITENISSYLWLRSDVEAGLENSLQYIEGNERANKEELDLLLMTKGWRRFKWKDIIANDIPNIIQAPMHGFEIEGRLTKNNGEPLSDIQVMHIDQFKGIPTFDDITTGIDGSFKLENLKYELGKSFLQIPKVPSNTQISLRLNNEQLFSSTGFLLSNGKATLPSNIGAKVEEPTRLISTIKNAREIDSLYYRDLGTYVVEGTKESQVKRDFKRGLSYNQGSYSYDVTAMMNSGSYFRNPLYVLLGRVPGFSMVTNKWGDMWPKVSLNRSDSEFRITGGANEEPLYFVDDMRVTLQDIMILNTETVDRIEVFKSTQAFHKYGENLGGVIAIYTKTPEELEAYRKKQSAKGDKKAITQAILPGGYTMAREFYAPNYSVEAPEHRKADLRNLIHWAPTLETDENGELKFTFYNADIRTTIQVRIEGISYNGTPVNQTIQYQVKEQKPSSDLQEQ